MKAIRRCLTGLDLFRGRSRGSLLLLLLITLLCPFIFFGLSTALSVIENTPPQIGMYGKIPLYFIKNDGQLPDRVKYYEKGPGHSILFSEDDVVFSFEKSFAPLLSESEARSPVRSGDKVSSPNRGRGPEFSRVRLFPVGMQRGGRIDGQQQQEGKVNYFIGKDPGKWRTNIATYGSVVYHEAYPGVDIKFYGSNHALEYDVIVKPGADPSRVRFGYQGIQDFGITPGGDLWLQLPDGGSLTHRKPVVYQEINGKRFDVEGGFHIEPGSPGTSPENTELIFGFDIASYHRDYPLIIDPVLVYSTYLGGLGSDSGNAIAVDAQGNAYFAGKTSSTNLPTTMPGLGPYAGGDADVFVTKLNATGTALVYSAYLGGNDTDSGLGIAVDSLGYAYITGETASDDFPTTASAFPNAPGSTGYSDAFAVKLNTTGTALIYSTYLGGSLDDVGQGISVDKFGQAYVGGVTSSPDFPIFGSALQHIYGGGYSDAFVVKLNNLGIAVPYSTFIGGTQADSVYAIALDDNGSIYVAGETASSDFPVPGGFQDTYGGGDADAFVMKILGTSGQVAYSTFLGGSNADFARGIAVDGSRQAYVTGKTSSPNFPHTNAIQSTYGGGDADAFVAKVSSQGDALSYATFLGGGGSDVGYAIAVDSNGNAYAAGRTSGNFPTVKAVQNIYGGGSSDAFVTRISAAGDKIDYSTYLGGSAADIGYCIAARTIGNVYVTGKTSSLDFPATLNAFMTFNTAGSDAFVAKLNALLANFSANKSIGTFPLTVQFTDASEGAFSSWFWDFGDGNSSTVQNPGHIYASPGSYTVSLSVSGFGGTDTLTKNSYITVTKPLISVTATDPVASEPGADKGQFTINCSDSRNVPITVNYMVSGTAANGADYDSLPGSVTIPAGLSSANHHRFPH